MHDYNENVSEENKLSFYGFDIQNPYLSVKNIVLFCENYNVVSQESIETILVLADGTTSYQCEEATKAFEEIKHINSILKDYKTEYSCAENYEIILRATECVLMEKELVHMGYADFVQYGNYRDACMASNVSWILSYEEAKNHEKIMIAGHNGHIGYAGNVYKTMGANIKDEFSEQYFTIGTDFYKTTTNASVMGSNSDRKNFSFCSADPLAKNAKQYGGSYYLAFDEVESDTVKTLINSNIPTGSLGEGLTFYYKFLPTAYRLATSPTSLYDAMIFVYETTPTTIIKK